jgi:hypothetical protein
MWHEALTVGRRHPYGPRHEALPREARSLAMSDEDESITVINYPRCPRCEGPMDPLMSKSKTRGGASICTPCENDENVHQWTHQPLPDPACWPVPLHVHLCKRGATWPLHRLMGGGNPYLYLWHEEPYSKKLESSGGS